MYELRIKSEKKLLEYALESAGMVSLDDGSIIRRLRWIGAAPLGIVTSDGQLTLDCSRLSGEELQSFHIMALTALAITKIPKAKATVVDG